MYEQIFFHVCQWAKTTYWPYLQVLGAGRGAPPDLRPGGHQRQDDPGPGRPHQVPQEADRPDEEHLSLNMWLT